MSEDGKADVANIIATAAQVNEPGGSDEGGKPKLLVEHVNPHRTVEALCAILAKSRQVYDRGVLVQLVFDQIQQGMTAQRVSTEGLILMAHSICRPYENKTQDGQRLAMDSRLPASIAKMCLDCQGQWGVPALDGIASGPRRCPGQVLARGCWHAVSAPSLTGGNRLL